MSMKQVKVNPVVFQMIQELSKASKKKPEHYLGDLITNVYGNR